MLIIGCHSIGSAYGLIGLADGFRGSGGGFLCLLAKGLGFFGSIIGLARSLVRRGCCAVGYGRCILCGLA